MLPYNFPQTLSEKVAEAPPSEPARKAVEHYQRTGEFRMEDLSRLLGQIKGVEAGPDSVPSWVVSKP